MPYANLTNPQTLNLYVMVRDNPETFADLDGHDAAADTLDLGGGGRGGGNPNQVCLLSITGDSTGFCRGAGDEGISSLGEGFIQILARFLADLMSKVNSDSKDKTATSPSASQAQQQLSQKSEDAILNSNLTGKQAIAFEDAVLAAGKANGIDPNILVGLASKESGLDPSAVNGSAKGLYQITPARQKDLGLSDNDLGNIGKVVSAVGGSLSSAMKTLNGNSSLAIASWTLGVHGTQRLFSSGGVQAVRNALLDRGHPEYGRVGPNYIDVVTSFGTQWR